MWILDSMGDKLLFTGTKMVKYFSRYGHLFALTLMLNFPEISASLEKRELTTDVTTSTNALSMLQFNIQQHSNFYVE